MARTSISYATCDTLDDILCLTQYLFRVPRLDNSAIDVTLYSGCLLRVLRMRAHGRLVAGMVAHDMPMLHNALDAAEIEREDEDGTLRRRRRRRARGGN